MAFAVHRVNNEPGKYLLGEHIDKVKLTVILTQKEDWGKRERKRKKEVEILP